MFWNACVHDYKWLLAWLHICVEYRIVVEICSFSSKMHSMLAFSIAEAQFDCAQSYLAKAVVLKVVPIS
jgi:hypothetical protein